MIIISVFTWAPIFGSNLDRFRSHIIQLQGDLDLIRSRAIHHGGGFDPFQVDRARIKIGRVLIFPL